MKSIILKVFFYKFMWRIPVFDFWNNFNFTVVEHILWIPQKEISGNVH